MRSSIKQAAFSYCYWSIAVGVQETASIQECIESARKAGIYRPFQIMTDRDLDDCDCYDAMSVDNPDGMNKLVYL